jgi:hypothetical protein
LETLCSIFTRNNQLTFENMAARRAPQLLRSSLAQAAKAPLGGGRVLPALSGLTARMAAPVSQRAAVSLPFEQARGLKTIDFAGTKETVYGKVFGSVFAVNMADRITQSGQIGRATSSL